MVKKYGDLYLQARRALLPTEGENAAAAARELLAFASGKSVAAVLADANLYASEQIEADLNGYVNRMLAHEPLPYILGQWDFYGISLEVTPDVLIPRDDTMAVTDLALEVLRTGHPSPRVLDLCCGSGCIGLAIAHQLPDAHVTLADISRPALAVAKRNIKRLKLMNRVTAIGLDAKKPAPSFVGTLDALVCNPPYVTAEEMTQLEPSVRDYEPALALDGGLFAMGQNMNVIVDSFNGTACGWGNNFWLVIALAVNFAIMAFGVGGGICLLGEVLRQWYLGLGLEVDLAGTLTSCTLIALSAVLTTLGLYQKLAARAGAGSLVPITGFANAVVSAAIEFKTEGRVLGTGAKMFTIAGPVIVYGTLAAVLYGGVLWLLGG